MPLETADGLVKFVVIPIDRVLLLGCPDGETPVALELFPQQVPGVGVVGDTLGEDVRSTSQRVLHRLDALVRIYVRYCQCFRHAVLLLEQQRSRQRL